MPNVSFNALRVFADAATLAIGMLPTWLPLFLGLLAAFSLANAQVNEVRRVEHVMQHPGSSVIRVHLSKRLAGRPPVFRTFHPAARVVLDIPDTSFAPQMKLEQPERGLVRGIRLLRHASASRLVIDLAAPATYEMATEDSQLVVSLRRIPPAPTRERWQRFGAAPAGQHLIRDVHFERGPQGEGRVIVSSTDGAAAIDVSRQGRRLIVSFFDTALAPGRELRLDVRDFATAVDAIETRATGRDVKVVIETEGPFTYSARQAEAEFTLSAAPLGRQ